MEALNVLSPSIEPHASGHIIEQIELVQKEFSMPVTLMKVKVPFISM